ncbi:uncharacterized protein LOC108923008 isoform X1 [Arapaima gigas]
MAREQDWLSSRGRLCELRVEPRPDGTWMPSGGVQVTVNCQSCPPPAYNKCSILSSLGIYSQALLKAAGGASARTRSSALEGFGQTLADSILQSLRLWVLAEAGRVRHFARREEANIDPSCRITAPPEGLALSATQEQKPPTETPWEVEAGGGDTMADNEGDLCAALGRSSLLSEGSVDYPSAPPTSPLLPETVRSPGGFSRSLKRGLANGFRPSPPPPTPKNPACSAQGSPVDTDNKEDFVERLMRSLSLECAKDELGSQPLQEDGTGRSGSGPAEVAAVSSYAERLSAEILARFLAHTSCPEEPQSASKGSPETCASSGCEAGTHPPHTWAERTVPEATPTKWSKLPGSSRQPGEPGPCGHGSGAEGVEEFAEMLVARILRQTGVCQRSNRDQEIRSSGAQRTQVRLEPQMSAPLAPWCGSFAASLAEEVLSSSLPAAAKQQRGVAGAEVLALLGGWKHSSSWVLQALLLWAAASQLDAAVLRLSLTDQELQTKLCRVAQQARCTSWTAGDLVASVLRFCQGQRPSVTELPLLESLHQQMEEAAQQDDRLLPAGPS